eukprot:350724-Chlamydomonas_euryale.AAC.6
MWWSETSMHGYKRAAYLQALVRGLACQMLMRTTCRRRIHCYRAPPVGRVFKIASDFIGLLVLGVFNASIAADAVGKDYKLKPGVRLCRQCALFLLLFHWLFQTQQLS